MSIPILLKQIGDNLFIPRRGYEPESVYAITWSYYNGYGVMDKALTVETGFFCSASSFAKDLEASTDSSVQTYRFAWTNSNGDMILVSEDYEFAWECIYLRDKHPKEVSEMIKLPYSKFVGRD